MSLAAADQFQPVTRKQPCEICGAPDWCRRSASGAAECHRSTASEVGGLRRIATTKAGFGVYRKPRSGSNGHTPRQPVVVTPPEPVKTADPLVGEPLTDAEIATHAAELGVSTESLRAIGACKANGRLATPEFDAKGSVTALVRRDPDGKKRAGRGHRRGLTIPTGFHDQDGTIFIVEGASDTAALVTVGLRALGRPNNLGGAELIAELVGDADICVIGENDAKPNGDWPGRDGAIRVATQLAERLGRPVRWALLPEGHKDTRAYVRANGHDCGPDLVSDLNETAETISPPADDIGPPPWADGDDGDGDIVGAGKPKSRAERIKADIEALPGDGRALNAKKPDAIADAFLFDEFGGDGGPKLRHYRGEWFIHDGASFTARSEDVFTALVRAYLLNCRLYTVSKSGDVSAVAPNRALVGEVMAATQAKAQLADDRDAPFFVTPRDGDPSPSDLVVFANGVFDTRADKFHPTSDARYFTQNALGYAFDPDARCEVWQSFLDDATAGDEQAIAALQMFCGYTLVPDCSQQKGLVLTGATGTGKSTFIHGHQQLIGPANYCTPSLTSIGESFGLAPFLGKLVAFFGDAHLGGRADTPAIVERLKSLIGQDTMVINRKYQAAISARLTTRVVIACNELPNLSDASNALLRRFIIVPFNVSFKGREDFELRNRIEREAPGLAVWALQGLAELRKQKRLLQPACGEAMLGTLARLLSPVSAFVEDLCVIDPAAETRRADLFESYRAWCRANGRSECSEEAFGNKLKSAYPAIGTTRRRIGGSRVRFYTGIRLCGFGDGEADE